MAELRYDITGTSNGLSAAVRSATTNLNSLERSANQTNAALRNDITSIRQLQADIAELNRKKIDIVDQAKLARTNRQIQELTAELQRAQRAGTVGFDQVGNAIGRSTSGLASFGVGLTRGLGYLRTFAYIIPGLGIAGIFNLAFEGISAAAGALGIFNNEAEKTAAELKKIEKEQQKEFGKDSFIDGAKSLSDLTAKIQLAKNGFLDKSKVLKEYNDTVGLTIGRVNSLGDAEQRIIDKGPAYLQFLLLKAKAEYAFRKAAEDSYNIDVQRNKFEQERGTPNARAADVIGKLKPSEVVKPQLKSLDELSKAFDKYGKTATDNIKKVDLTQMKGVVAAEYASTKIIGSLEKTSKGSQRIADQTQKQLERFAEENGFNVFAYANDKNKGASFTSQVAEQLDSILRKTQEIAGQSGIDSYALQVQKLIDKYKNLNIELDKVLEKNKAEFGGGKIDKKTFNENIQKGITDRQSVANAQYLELLNSGIKENQRVVDEIQRINDAFGIKSQEGRDKELAQIKAFYDKELKLARGNAEIIAALNSGRSAAEAATNRKFYDKAAQPFVDLFEKDKKKKADDAKKEESELSKILSRSLRNSAEDFTGAFKDLFETKEANRLIQKQIDSLNEYGKTLTDPEQIKKNADKINSLRERLADVSFDKIFSSLFSKLSSSLNKVFSDIILDGLSKSLSSAISKGTSSLIKFTTDANGKTTSKITGLGAAVAGAGIVGGVLSAATPQTSTLGQAAGGALTGAGAGFLVGGPVGAVVGGVVGALSGIFGASSARKKQEELQKQQLEEAKKQTEYLRQQQAAYTSQIIGRMTANGTITGINLNSQGELVAKISGSDILFVVQRAQNRR